MAETTGIQWTDSTFNPWRGCTKVSEGCKYCYAERGSGRNPKVLGVWGAQGTRVLASPAKWREPLGWHLTAEHVGGPHRVFCASLADVFEHWPGQMTDSQERPLWRFDNTPDRRDPGNGRQEGSLPYTLDEARRRLWWLIRQTPRLTWQLLTKRPENIARMMPPGDWPNVWLGVSVESQDYLPRLDALAEARERIRCPVGFVSYEPALGPLNALHCLRSVQWVIVGGESGGEARPMNLEWVRSLLYQCRLCDVPIFVKQLGKSPEPGRYTLRLRRDPGHNGMMEEFPEELQVREFPA